MMKKILIAVAVLALIVGGLAYWLVSDLDGLVHNAIEKAGSEALGVAVSVESVELDLKAGTGTIRGFEIANPPGFSGDPAFSAEELTLVLTRGAIELVRLQGPSVRIEGTLDENNFGALLDGMPQEAPPADESEVVDKSGEPATLQIDRVEIGDIRAVVDRPEPDGPAEVALGDVVFVDLAGTTEEIAHQAAGQLARHLADATRTAIRDAVGTAVEQKVDEVKEGLRERIGGAFKNSDDDGDEEAEDDGGDGD